MTREETRDVGVAYWMRKADVSLESAAAEFAAGRFDFVRGFVSEMKRLLGSPKA